MITHDLSTQTSQLVMYASRTVEQGNLVNCEFHPVLPFSIRFHCTASLPRHRRVRSGSARSGVRRLNAFLDDHSFIYLHSLGQVP